VAAALAVAAVGAVTWVALEGREVVVLRTFAGADGATSDVDEARIWIADDGQAAAWIEAATTDKAFYRRLVASPEVEVVRDTGTFACRAEPRPSAADHARMRALFARTYGRADAWVGLLVDTSRSTAVHLRNCREVGGVSRDVESARPDR